MELYEMNLMEWNKIKGNGMKRTGRIFCDRTKCKWSVNELEWNGVQRSKIKWYRVRFKELMDINELEWWNDEIRCNEVVWNGMKMYKMEWTWMVWNKIEWKILRDRMRCNE